MSSRDLVEDLIAEQRKAAESLLRAMWFGMRDNASESAQQRIAGAIFMARILGIFDVDRSELWSRRVQTCPGHADDQGSRSWCGYCGEMSKENVP